MDPSGSVLPGVTVTITEVHTNIAYSAVTNESGNDTFSNLKDGTYRVSGELSGFKRVVRDGVEVPVNSTVRVDMKLEVGAIEESVTVVGASPLLQTGRADTSRIIESVHLAEVPLGFNRNFQGMMVVVPGALRMQRPHSDVFNAQDSLSTNLNGQSRLANKVQIEGIDDNHRTGLLTTLIPSAEAIETVNISTSAYDAEFGRAGGALTNVTLKSGTNTIRGSVFAFGNNEKTNAPGYFTHTAPPGDYLQSGFTLGGPLRRNKLFFFGDYQHINDNAGRTTRAIIPPAAYRNGDFSASPTRIYDPATGNPDGTGRTPFEDNIIPADRISPIAKAILANVPAPNVAAAPGQPNDQIDYARVKTTDSFDTKFNWQLSQADQISGRFSFLRPKLIDPAEFGAFGGSKQGSPSGNGFSGVGTDTTYSTGVDYTRSWSSTLVMEARGGMNYFRNQALTEGDGLKTAAEVGIRGANIDEWNDLLHARARLELRQRRLEHRHPDAGRRRAELGAHRPGSPAQLRRELPLPTAGGAGRRWLRDGPLSQILGGWQVSGIFSAQSGAPIQITMSAAALNAPGNTQRPDVTGTPKVLGAVGPGALWFDTSVFSSPPANTFGNSLRNGVLDGPAYVNLDATIAKLFSFGKVKGEFRVDIFNITNTPHFNNPNGTFLGATFGQITSTIAGSERSMRFGFRMMF